MNKYIIKPPDHEFTDIPAKILGDPGFMPHIKVIISTLIIIYIYLNMHTLDVMYTLSNIYFQDWIRAIDALEDQKPYIGRKGIPTQKHYGRMQFQYAIYICTCRIGRYYSWCKDICNNHSLFSNEFSTTSKR